MLGTRIVLNEDKILAEKKYSLQAMYDTIDEFAKKLDFIKKDKFTYLAKDDKDTLSNLGLFCHSGLMKLDWFINNLSEWILLDDKDGNIDLIKKMKTRGQL